MMVDEAHRLKNDESALYKVRTQARAHVGAAALLGALGVPARSFASCCKTGRWAPVFPSQRCDCWERGEMFWQPSACCLAPPCNMARRS